MGRPRNRAGTFIGIISALTLEILIPILAAWTIVSYIPKSYYPKNPDASRMRPGSYGPVKMRLRLPGTAAGIPEPVLSCGRAGKASLIYVRLLKNARAKVGIDFWGLTSVESKEFQLPASDAEIEFDCSIPAFHCWRDDPDWEDMTPARRERLRGEYVIAVNGAVQLKGTVNYPQEAHAQVFIGVNPLGGSLVSDIFTGSVVNVMQGD